MLHKVNHVVSNLLVMHFKWLPLGLSRVYCSQKSGVNTVTQPDLSSEVIFFQSKERQEK